MKRATMWWLGVSAVLLSAAPAAAQTGVDDDRVSLPDGPGSLEGVGDNVEIDPNMGTMRWQVPVEVPRGFSGLEPDLGLGYASGAGTGLVGIGWNIITPTIERMLSRGVPRYTVADRFAADGGEELVLVSSAGGERVYRARYEGGFVRYVWSDAGAGEGGSWRAEYPDGRVAHFGADAQGQEVASARTTHPDGGVYRYHLVEEVDTAGHSARYSYDRFDGNRALPVEIAWAFVEGTPRYRAQLTWEERPDILSDCGAGFEEVLSYRLSAIRVFSGAELIREAVLDYEDNTRSGGASRLRAVRQYGVGGQAGGELYPIVFGFEYSKGLGAQCEQGEVACGRPYLVDMGTLGGGVNLASENATLIDINGDGLPDVLDTSGIGPHRFFLSRLTPEGEGFTHGFAPPVESAVATGGTFQLSGQNVQTLDINGDGYSDLINTTTGATLLNGGIGADWAMAGGDVEITALPTFTGSAYEQLRFTDYDNDKRIDVLQSTSSETRVFRNTGAGFEAELVEAIGLGFATSNLQLADMNGDGLNDPVEVLEGGGVRFRLNLGRGRWSGFQTVPGVNVPPAEQALVDLEDLNGDGLDDIVVVVGTTIKYALNRNANTFDAFVTLTSADIEGGLPAREDGVTVLYADMNGNGSEDVVWFDANGRVRYLELFPVRPNLLTRITNGIGMVQEITWGTSVEHAARAAAAGEPWEVALPHATAVVDRIDLYVTLTGDDDGSGVHEVTSYDYRNGYYDGEEKQFRGFSDVVSTLRGDASQEEGITRYTYDNGVVDDYRNGLLLSEIVESEGRVLRETTNAYDDCPVDEVPNGVTPPVRHICLTAQDVLLKEGASAPAWVLTRTESVWDGYGNVTRALNQGVVARGGVACGAACEGDESTVETTFVPPSATGGRWLLNAPSRVQSYTDPNDPLRSDVRYFYDGEPFEGLPAGQLTRGFVTRVEASVDDTTRIQQLRVRRDDDGNVVESFDPEGDPANLAAHRRTSVWDESGLFLLESDVHLTDGEGAPYAIRRAYSYDLRFQKVQEATDYMLVRDDQVLSPRNSTRYSYDVFGRTSTVIKPGDERATPTQEYTYALADPVSRITIRSRSRSGEAPDETFHRCLDGRGRKVQDRVQIDASTFQVFGFTIYNNRGNEVERFQPWTAATGTCDMTTPQGVASTRLRYDALGRTRRVEAPDGSIHGTPSVSMIEYTPLAEIEHDPNDLDPASPHFETPTTTVRDGLGRTVELQRVLREGNAPQIATTRLGYDNIGNLATLTDAEGNVRAQTCDRLGRPVEVTSPASGTTRLAYDASGNLTERTDARGITTRYVYDGANRLIERYEDGRADQTRTTWRFDLDPDCPAEDCTNLPGRLASAHYPLGPDSPLLGVGHDRVGYSIRGVPTFNERRLGDVSFVTRATQDNRDRRTLTTHPDGTEVPLRYDALGRVIGSAGFIDAARYDDRAQISALDLANGARQTWSYDALMRLNERTHLDGAGTIIEARGYTRDRAGRILQIEDLGPAVEGMPSLDMALTYDAWYRPRSISLSAGTDAAEVLDLRYGLLDQLDAATSSLGPDSPAHLGDFTYSAEQPLAAQTAGDLTYSYDDAGYTQERGAQELTWDHQGRLTAVSGPAPFVAVYGADQTRVIKRDGGSLILYASDDFEVRDGVATTYVRFAGRRVARHQSLDPAIATRIYPDLAPEGAPDERISAADAFALSLLDGGMDPDLVLGAAAARMLAEEEDATVWLHSDHLTNLTAATDEGGAVRGRRAFYPLGQLRAEQGFVDAHGFTGQELDEGTGLTRFAFRYLDPRQGRWLSADPAFERLGPGTLERLAEAVGAYSYVANDPINVYDPLGLQGSGASKSKSKTKTKKKKKKLSERYNELSTQVINLKRDPDNTGSQGRVNAGTDTPEQQQQQRQAKAKADRKAERKAAAIFTSIVATVPGLTGVAVLIGIGAGSGSAPEEEDEAPSLDDSTTTPDTLTLGPEQAELYGDHPEIAQENSQPFTPTEESFNPGAGSPSSGCASGGSGEIGIRISCD